MSTVKGKWAIRGNLSGKRVDFSVDGYHRFNLRITRSASTEVARMMTYPGESLRHNLQHLRSLIINGPSGPERPVRSTSRFHGIELWWVRSGMEVAELRRS